MKNRTGIDFSKHQHRIDIYKNEEGKEIRIDHLQVGNSRTNYIQFINTDEILTVTGDFGNWVFCRPFVPKAGGLNVHDGYWIEKLRILSEQHLDNLDFEWIEKEINNLLKSGLEEYGYEGDELTEIKEWFTELLDVCRSNDKLEYLFKAYRDPYRPSNIDNEMIPYSTEIPNWLLIILDGFDEICNRLTT